MSAETRFDVNNVAEAFLQVHQANLAAETSDVLFEAYGLNVYEVEAVLSRVSPERLSKIQAMALGLVVGVCLAEAGSPTGEGRADEHRAEDPSWGCIVSAETRFDVNNVAEAFLQVHQANLAAETWDVLFAAYGLNVYEVEAVLSRVSPERLSKHQAMAVGMVIGVQLAESGPPPGEGPQG